MTDTPQRLSNQDGEVLLATVAELAVAQLPLAEGLRAAAAESRGRVSRGFAYLADQVAAGRTIDQICLATDSPLPLHLRGLVAAAARTGQLGTALEELIAHQRTARRLRGRVLASLAYPLAVIGMNIGVLGFLLGWVTPLFKTMFLEFDLQLPAVTSAVVQMGDAVTWLFSSDGTGFLVGIAGVSCAFLVAAVTGRGAWLQGTLVDSFPLLGVLAQWTEAANFFYLLAALLDKHVPLPDALRYTAAGTRKADLKQSALWLANEVQAGKSLADLVERSGCWPAGGIPWIRRGEQNQSLARSLRLLSEIYEERAVMRAEWLRINLGPLMFVFVGMSVGSIIVALFMPLVSLIQGLS